MSRYRKGIARHAEEQTLRLLSEFEPLCYRDLMELTGLTQYPASTRLRGLVEAGAAHISGYVKLSHSMPTPYFSIGRLPNVKAPAKFTELQKAQRYRARVKKEQPELWSARIKKAWAIRHAREAADPSILEKRRASKKLWGRKKFGYIPREMRDPAILDEIAMQFGCTWRFAGWRMAA